MTHQLFYPPLNASKWPQCHKNASRVHQTSIVEHFEPSKKISPKFYQHFVFFSAHEKNGRSSSPLNSKAVENMVKQIWTFAQDRVPVIPDHFISICSSVQLDWFIKGRLVCGLPVIHAPKIPLGNAWGHSKRVGESPWSRASNSGRSQNPWASICHRHPTQWYAMLNEQMQKKKTMFTAALSNPGPSQQKTMGRTSVQVLYLEDNYRPTKVLSATTHSWSLILSPAFPWF
jgi:hypothetical protein